MSKKKNEYELTFEQMEMTYEVINKLHDSYVEEGFNVTKAKRLLYAIHASLDMYIAQTTDYGD